MLAGPEILFATPVKGGGRPVLLATVDADGRLSCPVSDRQLATADDSKAGYKPIPPAGDGQLVTVALPGTDATAAQIAQAVQSGRPIFLRTWPGIVASRQGEPAFQSVVTMDEMGGSNRKPRRLPFMFDLVVVPASSLGANIDGLATRAKESQSEKATPIFGTNLEKRPENWAVGDGWKFTSQGLLVTAGDIGLLDGEDYGDYRFDFELTVPKEGQGIAGWVVRARTRTTA